MRKKRRYARSQNSHHMDIRTATGDAKIYITLDLSEGGMFVLATVNEQLPVGTEVIVTPALHTLDEQTPIRKGRVARRSILGMGIEFLEQEAT